MSSFITLTKIKSFITVTLNGKKRADKNVNFCTFKKLGFLRRNVNSGGKLSKRSRKVFSLNDHENFERGFSPNITKFCKKLF